MILVTGGTGLVGSHLLFQLCQQGKRIRAIRRKSSNLEIVERIFLHYSPEFATQYFEQIEWVEADLLDVPALESAIIGVEFVYHAAALVDFGKGNMNKLYEANVVGTANIVNLCLEFQVSKLCYVSSTAAIGRSDDQGEIKESNEWKESEHNSNYSKAKQAAEMEVWRGIEEGLSAVIVNPSIIMGPADPSGASGGTLKKVWDGLKFYTAGSNAVVDVRDVVQVMVELMNSEINSERYLVIGENISYCNFFATIAEKLGKAKASIRATPLMGELAWRILLLVSWFSRRAPVVTKETMRMSQNSYSYSRAKLDATIDIQFNSFEDSVANAVLFFKKHYT